MILEATGLQKPAYFINPLGKENPFFADLEYLNNNFNNKF